MTSIRMTETDQTCFVISPIGGEGTEIRTRSDKVFNHIIDPVVKEYGYKPERSDHIAEPGIITSQVIERVVESPLVIADLTGSNPNVFYELAVRHTIQKPVIQLISTEDKIPFDVSGTRLIKLDIHDLDSVSEAKRQVGSQIEHIKSEEPTVDTPISLALDLKDLRESDDPEERSIAEITETLSDLRNRMNTVQHMLDQRTFIPNEERSTDLRQVLRSLDSIENQASIIGDYLQRLHTELKQNPSDAETTMHRIEEIMQESQYLIDTIESEKKKIRSSDPLGSID